MEEIPTYRVLIAATLVFIVGLFIFSVIFKAYITFKKLEAQLLQTGYKEDQATLMILASIPWTLGGFYISLVGMIIYFVLKGNKVPKSKIPPRSFRY